MKAALLGNHFLVKALERPSGQTGRRGKGGVEGKGPKGGNIWGTELSKRLQSASLGKGPWFATGFMGDSPIAKIATRSACQRFW